MLRRICGPKREEMAAGCRRLHNEELHNLYASPNIIRMIKSRRMILAGHVAQIGEINIYRILVSKPEGKRPLGRRRHKWEDSIIMDRNETGSEGEDWISLAQNRDPWRALVKMVMNFGFRKRRGIS